MTQSGTRRGLSDWIAFDRETPAIARGGWLDALRFIVAFLIIVHHFELAAPIPLKDFHPVFERGYLLTNFFLIDSGYVLARIYGAAHLNGGQGLGEFLRKRFLRVFPAHLMVLGALVAMTLGATAAGVPPRNPEWFDWSQLPAQVFLVQSFGVPGGVGWNAPTWSVSALLGCYLAFPFMVKLIHRRCWWMALAIGAGVYACANLAAWALVDLPVYQMPLKYGIWRALPLFLLGVMLARLSDTVWIHPRLAAWGMGAAFAAICVLQYFGRYSLICIALICLILLFAAAIPAKGSKLVEKAAVVSFSMFISNEVVRIGWFGVVNTLEARLGLGDPVQWALWALSIPAAVAIAWAFHHAVDWPLQQRLKRWKLRLPRRKLQPAAEQA